MIKYILKRLGLLLLTLFLIVTLTFFMMQVMPGTPFSNPKLTPDQLEILKHAYGYTADNIVKEEQRLQFMKEYIRRLRLEYDDENEFISSLFS